MAESLKALRIGGASVGITEFRAKLCNIAGTSWYHHDERKINRRCALARKN
jgi:hypothetical protein